MGEPGFRFCPVCGSPFEPRVLRAGDPPRLVCTSQSCRFVFYLDPKVAVGTVISRANGDIVLVKRAIEPGYGKWVFPGGYVDRGEEITLAARRGAAVIKPPNRVAHRSPPARFNMGRGSAFAVPDSLN